MFRFHLGVDDLARIRLMRPAPLDAVSMSLSLLRRPTLDPVMSSWRQRTMRRLPATVRPLFALIPPTIGWPDYLTPRAANFDAGVDAVLSTPVAQVRAELEEHFDGRRPPAWVAGLAHGDTDAMRLLERGLRDYYRACIGPEAALLDRHAEADLEFRSKRLREGGVEALFSSLWPLVRWEPPVLTVRSRPLHEPDIQVHECVLEGRGLVFVPSAFVGERPAFLLRDHEAPIVFYPARGLPELLAEDDQTGPRPIEALIGRTRAAVLQHLRTPATTTELARRAGISPASASEHARILREAGLVTSSRHGMAVRHTITELGSDLLGRHALGGE